MRCPVCKAENTQGPNCRRCKADLGLLFTLEEHRRRVLAEARQSFSAGDWPAAAQAAVEADHLQSDDESRRLVALSFLFSRDFAAAWGSYLRARGDAERAAYDGRDPATPDA
jgi:hypothetical protein